jgi:hypothetical protein
MYFIFRLVLCLLPIGCAAIVAAQTPPGGGGGTPGYRVKSYSGGVWMTSGVPGIVYGDYGGSYGGGALTGGGFPGSPPLLASGPGTASATGQITVVFEWDDGGNPANLPPPVAIVKETSFAYYFGDSGSCANGLGNPVVMVSPYEAYSSGIRWTVKQNPGVEFQ